MLAQAPPPRCGACRACTRREERKTAGRSDADNRRWQIVSSGAAAEAKIPADAVRIDLPNATVLPGLIDAHTHLTMDPKFGYEELGISIPRETLIGAKNARVTLLAGFTTVRNVGASGYTDVALRDAINAGDVPGQECW